MNQKPPTNVQALVEYARSEARSADDDLFALSVGDVEVSEHDDWLGTAETALRVALSKVSAARAILATLADLGA